MADFEGFAVHAWRAPGDDRLFLAGRLADGRSFAAADREWRQSIWIPASRAESAAAVLASHRGISSHAAAELAFDGRDCFRLDVPPASFAAVSGALEAAGIEAFRSEEKAHEAWMLDRLITGPLTISGECRQGHRVDLAFPDARFSPSKADVALRWLCLDVETDRAGRVRAVSALARRTGEPDRGECLLVRPGFEPPAGEASWLRAFDSEADALVALASRIRELDPDLLTGWNAIDFDFRVLDERFRANGCSLDVGRAESGGAARYFPKEGARSAAMYVPGRKCVDAMRIARASPERYEDLSLESVANAVLGEGKDVKRRGEEKLAALDELYGRDPVAFSAYCLKDSRLALDILRATGLDELTLRRASLAGVPLDRAWTSVPAFEAVYAAGLKRRGMLPPARRPGRVGSAPGGMILEPAPGFFHDVIVLDFKSLYPTIMLTFNIDPLAYSRAKADPALGAVAAPNGARFSRELGILPEAIDGYLSARDEAKSRGDAIASYVYKILMNSFYGVLASDACRYSDEAIAGAITSFGHKYLSRARDLLVERGARVLYGDTDSVFLVPAAFSDAPPKASGPDAGRAEALEREGRSLVASLNEAFAVEVSREYGVRSRLEIKLEKAYDRFLLPSVRGVRASERRGRAKGYAGRLAATGEVEIKGMEAARSDWTPFAKRFQLELLERAFRGDGPSELRAFVASEEMRLESGALDAELVFRRSLRRAPDDYVKVEPPHVRAARLAGLTDARGVIEYVLTTDGAQPVGAVVSPIDRARYIESQLLPIALSVEDAMGVRFVPEGRGAQGSFDF